MDKDLKWIKKHYGEKMMHLCREHFFKILETEGLLSSILNEHFDKNKSLAEDIIEQEKVEEFKNYIYSFVNVEQERPKIKPKKSAVQLLDEAGYILYPECKTEKEVQSFKKYYKEDEKLCTFNGGRLNTCRVWFAVKKDVENIKRENFTKPSRQDEYGTSVISIQFAKSNQTLSIKNRYNHTVNNPDNTFNSYLDNIIEGLTDAFEKDYGVRDKSKTKYNNFELEHYVRVGNKFYRYNHEINNIYYCDNNIIIDNFEVKKLNTDSQILADYFVFDLKQKKAYYYDEVMQEYDSFIESIGEIEDMYLENNKITIKVKEGEDVIVKLNQNKQIIGYINPNVKVIGNYFLEFHECLEELDMQNLIMCMDDFCFNNTELKVLSLPNLTKCGMSFCRKNNSLTEISFENMTKCGSYFFYCNQSLKKANFPKLEMYGMAGFLENNKQVEIYAPKFNNFNKNRTFE